MPARIEDLDAALYQVMLAGLEKRLARVRAVNARLETRSEADDTSMSTRPLEPDTKQT